MFAVFFVLGGVCSTLIPLTFGSQKFLIGTLSLSLSSLARSLARSLSRALSVTHC